MVRQRRGLSYLVRHSIYFSAEPVASVRPEFGIVLPEDEVAAPMGCGIRGVGHDAAFPELADTERWVTFA